MTDYEKFLFDKSQLSGDHGFEPLWMLDCLFDFQKYLLEFNLRKGRSATFADCGMGKTPLLLTWAENICRKTNGRVLIFTPLAVSAQTVREAAKFEIDCQQSRNGNAAPRITVTNYERISHFKAEDFQGVVCDESSILKNFDGATKAALTEFMRRIPYRLLCTATPSPNDFIELGTSSEALGYTGYMDMLKEFFKQDGNTYAHGGSGGGKIRRFDPDKFQGKFRFKGHSETSFWRWVCSWARAARKPSDLGFKDAAFKLPKLILRQHIIEAKTLPDGFLFPLPASGLREQNSESKRTVQERCEKAASVIEGQKGQSIAWCHRLHEGDLLAKLIPDSVQVTGSDSDDFKEETFSQFQDGKIKRLITKPSIAGLGLNFQKCAHQTFFPSHSYEQWHQAIRRSWRFGQKHPVEIDIVTSDGEANVIKNLQRKELAADRMFSSLVTMMNNELSMTQSNPFHTTEEKPIWLS